MVEICVNSYPVREKLSTASSGDCPRNFFVLTVFQYEPADDRMGREGKKSRYQKNHDFSQSGIEIIYKSGLAISCIYDGQQEHQDTRDPESRMGPEIAVPVKLAF